MKIRNILVSITIILGAWIGIVMAQTTEPTLPKVTILGKTFYYYESQKGETLKDIAARFNWDESILTKTNSEVSGKPSAGTLLYYPAADSKSSKVEKKSGEPNGAHIHIVRSGETAYGIAKLYNIPLDSIYALNPGSINGIKKGDKLMIEQPVKKSSEQLQSQSDAQRSNQDNSQPDATQSKSSLQSGFIYHTVSDGESLYGIAHKYSTTIEDLFKLNPGLTAGNPSTGEMIKIRPDSFIPEVHKEVVEEQNVGAIREYKAKRGDSFESIAEQYNIPVNDLIAANPGIDKINKGDKIHIPVIEIVKVEKDVVVEDPRSLTEKGVEEIYHDVHSANKAGNHSSFDGIITERPSVAIAIVLTDIGQTAEEKRSKRNKEMEFSRGAIKGVDDLKDRPFKTRLSIIDGNLEPDSITSLLNDFQPTMIVNTSASTVPEYLLNYVDSTSVKLLNAFYVKDEAYVNNPNIIQFLTPSSYMNSNVAEYFLSAYPDYKLIVAGNPDPTDHLGNQLIRTYAEKGTDMVEEIPIADIERATLANEDGKYLIYGTPSLKTDVQDLLKRISTLRDRYILADIKVIGRPNWLPFATSSKDVVLRELIGSNKVSIPSRFYFDPEEPATKKFIDDYKSIFKVGPMKASPVYCATAYDIITYFAPNIVNHNGDFNETFTQYPTIQSPILLDRMSNWGGIINQGTYIINFQPFGITDRVIIPQP